MNARIASFGLSCLAVAVLTACGGGSSDTTAAAPATPATPATVAAGVTTTLTALGNPAAVTAANATSTAYDLVAAIGDTWRVNFDSTGSAFAVTVLKTQYGLTNTSTGTSGTYTLATSGNYTTYTLSGTAGTLVVDNRTKAIAGNMTVGGKASTVAGTGYAAPALDKLAGTYNFAYATRNASDGLSQDLGGGQFNISADGATVKLCPGGLINATATACSPQLPLAPSTPVSGTIATAGGVTTVKDLATNVEFGTLHVHVGDRGPVLLIDRYGSNRTGAFYAAKATSAAGTEFDGNWTCTLPNGTVSSNPVVSGTTATAAGRTLTVYYNQVYNVNTGATLTLPGFGSVGTSLANSGILLALSSSLVVVQGGNGQELEVCRRTN